MLDTGSWKLEYKDLHVWLWGKQFFDGICGMGGILKDLHVWLWGKQFFLTGLTRFTGFLKNNIIIKSNLLDLNRNL